MAQPKTFEDVNRINYFITLVTSAKKQAKIQMPERAQAAFDYIVANNGACRQGETLAPNGLLVRDNHYVIRRHR